MTAGARRVVLVVDDSPEDVDIVRRYLRRAATPNAGRPDAAVGGDYETRHVDLGREGLRVIAATPPDVVLLDMSLPDMSGLEFLEAAAGGDAGNGAEGDAADERAESVGRQPVPIIMLTGDRRQLETAVAALQLGALDFLPKSDLSPELLRQRLDRAVQRFATAQVVERQRLELERLYEAERRARLDAESAREEAERERAVANHARARADEANAAKAQFLAAMSHELRTPLNAIQGYAELLALGVRGAVSETQRADLERIQRSGRHLLTVINEILQYAKIEAGRLTFDIQRVELAPALADLLTLIEPQLRTKRLTYDGTSCDPGLTVLADRDKLQQIVLNLIANAVKFTPPGGRVAVACTVADGRVQVRVSDTGIGIAVDKLAGVFDPFVQVERRLSSPRDGVGLGLAISRDLARAMGGDLTAESEPGVGSTFTLTLPAA